MEQMIAAYSPIGARYENASSGVTCMPCVAMMLVTKLNGIVSFAMQRLSTRRLAWLLGNRPNPVLSPCPDTAAARRGDGQAFGSDQVKDGIRKKVVRAQSHESSCSIGSRVV